MPSFTTKVAVKVASFKKGAKKVVAKLSFKKGMSDKVSSAQLPPPLLSPRLASR